MSAITAKASRIMKKYAVLTREPRCFLGSFDFSWEQRKLGDVVQITMGQSPDGSTYSDEPSDYILVQGNAGLQNGWVCPRIWTTQITKKADAGDLIMSVRAPAGAMGKTAYNAVIGRGVAAIKGNEFIYQLLVKMDTDGFWKTLSCGSTFESLNSDNIKNAEVKIPTTAEQKKIGGLFQYLDNLITLHQRKCANLCSPSQVVFSLLFATSTFSWEQRKLSEMCGTFEYGLNAAAKEFDGKNKYIRITDIDDASREFLLSDLSSPDICLDGMSKYLLSSGDIVFARTGASVGKTYIYRENDGIVYFAGFLIRAKVNQDNDAEFVFQSTLSPSYEKYIRITSQRSGQPGVNAQEYGEYDLFAPSKEEQQRIGHFLRGIDNLITLHQRECISFTGRADRLILTANKKRTTSSWEQRKLGDVGETYTGLSGKTKADFGHGQARFITYMNVFSNPISNPEMTEPIEIDPKQNEVEVGDVFFTTSSETPEEVGMSSVLLEKRGKIYLNSFCFGFRPTEKIDSYYLAYMLRSESAREKIILLAQGISRYNISKNKVMEIAVSLPSLDEQKLIGQYFRQLDNLITLHQRKPFLMKWRTSDANRNQTNRLVL